MAEVPTRSGKPDKKPQAQAPSSLTYLILLAVALFFMINNANQGTQKETSWLEVEQLMLPSEPSRK